MTRAVATRNWTPLMENVFAFELAEIVSYSWKIIPQWLRFCAIFGPALRFVCPRAARKTSVGSVVSGYMTHPIAPRGRALYEVLAILAFSVPCRERNVTEKRESTHFDTMQSFLEGILGLTWQFQTLSELRRGWNRKCQLIGTHYCSSSTHIRFAHRENIRYLSSHLRVDCCTRLRGQMMSIL